MTEISFQKNVNLASHTSWLVGGPAEYFAEPANLNELIAAQSEAQKLGIKVTILGGGTNVLVADQGIPGLVISLAKLTGVTIEKKDPVLELAAWSGTPKSELLKIFLKHKLVPAAMMAGLPGQVGGGVVMNAGVSESLKPREFCEITSWVEVLRPQGKVERVDAKDIRWSYRSAVGWQPGIIVRVGIAWPNEPEPKIVDEVKRLNQIRLQKQPLEYPSCGSVFRNPLPQRSGQLIEQAGLKGYTVGGAQVSEKHANFIINKGGAKASDVEAVVQKCMDEVKGKFGVSLHPEFVKLG